MKFLLQLEYCTIPEWSEYYIDYKVLKDTLHEIPIKDKNANVSLITFNQTNADLIPSSKEFLYESLNKPALDLSTEEKLSSFVSLYQAQIQKISNFLNNKEEELETSFTSLQNKITSNNRKNSGEMLSSSKINERDEMGYAVSWKRAISSLYTTTCWLHSYHSVHIIGIKKIIKSTNKIVSQFNCDQSKIIGQLEQINLSFGLIENSAKITALRKKMQLLYSKEFCNGNMKKGVSQLDERLKSKRTKHSNLIAFYLGANASCLIILILISFFSPKKEEKTNTSILVFFPVFGFVFFFIELLIGTGFVISIIKNYRINYIYIFEVEPQNRLGHVEMYQNGLALLSMWSLLLLLTKLSLMYGLFDGKFFIFPLACLLFTSLFFLFPFHCSYLEFRKGILITLFRNFFPLSKNSVRFRDFVFGDVLTSLNKPFTNVVISFCLFACSECREKNENLNGCNRSSIGSLIVLFYPFFIRFTQCINRFYFTREAWPHLGNSLKYIGGMSNAIFGWLYANNKDYLLLHVIIGFVSTSYMTFWDFYMDWGLLRFKSKYLLLRDNIVYPKNYYYLGMLSNLLLRFAWLINFVDFKPLGVHDEVKIFILMVLEVYRRIQWGLFRIENENTNNPEKYREILEIPQLPYE